MKYLDSIKITNLAGFTNYEANFADVTVILGQNEAGKSSLLRCVATIFQGGADSDLLKDGAKKGLASYSFTNGYRAFKEINPERKPGYSTWVENPQGGKITSGAQTMVNEWLPKDCFDVRNLVRMIVNDSKALEKYMLANWPVDFSGEELNPILRGMLPAVVGKRTLAELNAMRQALYDQRTDVKKNAAEAQATLRSLEDAIGDADSVDWGLRVEFFNSQLVTVAADLARLVSEIKLEAEQARTAKRDEIMSEIDAIAKRCAEYVGVSAEFYLLTKNPSVENRPRLLELWESLKSGHAAFLSDSDRKESLLGDLADYMAKVDHAEQEAVQQHTADLSQRQAEISNQLGAAQEKANKQQQSSGLKQQIETQRKRMDGHITKETTLSMVLEEIDRIKATKLREFPIEGLDINMEDKQPVITINGKALSVNINTQNQIKIGIKFVAEAQKRSGCEMRIMVVEGAEVDTDHLVELAQICRDEKIQLIISVLRTGTDLHVFSIEDHLKFLEAASVTSSLEVGAK